MLSAILNDSKILASKAAKKVDRLLALKFLGHWVGDIHPPLHVSFEDDRGGNNIRVSGRCSGKLHSTWDTCLVEDAVGTDVADVCQVMGERYQNQFIQPVNLGDRLSIRPVLEIIIHIESWANDITSAVVQIGGCSGSSYLFL